MKRKTLFFSLALAFILSSLSGLQPSAAYAGKAADSPAGRFERIRTHRTVWKNVLERRGGFATGRTMDASDTTGSISGFVYGLDPDAVFTAYVEAIPLFRIVDRDTVYEPYKGGVSQVRPDDFSFSITGLVPGPYWVYASADDYAPEYYDGAESASDADTVSVKPGEDVTGIRFSLEKFQPGTGGISGTIVDDDDGSPLAAAWVTAVASWEPYTYGRAMTDEQGRFVIGGLKSGSYTLSAGADGYVEEFFDDARVWELAAPVAVAEPDTTTGLVIRLTEGGIISGRVTDSTGSPVTDAWIQVYSNAPGDSGWIDPTFEAISKFDAGASTDADGAYRITGIPEGEYFVTAYSWWSPWFQNQIWYDNAPDPSSASVVPVRSGEETGGIDFMFDLQAVDGSVTGRVTDLDGRPVEYAQIQIFSDGSDASGGSVWMNASTDVNGNYSLYSVPEGSYYVNCWAQAGWSSVFRYWPDSEDFSGAQAISVDGKTAVCNVDFILPLSPGTSSIEGTVTDAAGHPLTGVYVEISPFRTGDADSDNTAAWFSAWAYSDSAGEYRVKGLPAGPVRVYSSYWEGDSHGEEWYNDATVPEEADPVTLSEGQTTAGVDFSLTVRRLYGTITGTVTDAGTGAPVPDAVVEIQPIKTDWVGFRCGAWKTNIITDSEGKYSADWLLSGTYLLSAYREGGFAYYRNAPVSELADSVALEGGGSVTADFNLAVRNEGPCVIRGSVTYGNGGPLRGGWEDAGPGGAVAGRSRLLKADSDLAFNRAIIIAKPVFTILSWPESELFYNTLSGEDGSYELTGLPAGEYYVWSFGGTAIPQYWDHTTDPARAQTVRVEAGSPVEGVDFELDQMLFYAFDEAGRNQNAVSVRGTVRDGNGSPVSSAVILLLNVGGQAVASGVTGPDGVYALSAAAGDYILQAGKLGYGTAFNGGARSAEEAVPVRLENGSVEVNFSLSAASAVPPGPALPDRMTLDGNYPNPFNPSTLIRFSLPTAGKARLTVLDSRGRTLRVLRDGASTAGRHQALWDARDGSGRAVPSGLYFYRLETESGRRTGKMILIR
jgi:protocatechuate 3,4-dioxygenase beta subunit